jgi:hypothetical protein
VTGPLYPYATSHRLEQIGPQTLRKHLGDDALVGEAARVMPSFVHDPRREPAVYRELLGPCRIGPRCFDSGDDWLDLELLDVDVLWQVGEGAIWVAVASWVAEMHRRLRAVDVRALPLVVHDAALFAKWGARAAAARVDPVVLSAHARATERLCQLPVGPLHGDLYASNVMVRSTPSGVEVWPVDWELAGVGPTVLDVVAITAGSGIDAATRSAMLRAYFLAAASPPGEWERWLEDLDAARLHQCVQWLAWAPGWTPPPQHRQDWAAQAHELAARL